MYLKWGPKDTKSLKEKEERENITEKLDQSGDDQILSLQVSILGLNLSEFLKV